MTTATKTKCDYVFPIIILAGILIVCAATLAYIKLATWCWRELSPTWFATWLTSSYASFATTTLLVQRSLPWAIRPKVTTAILLSALWPAFGFILLIGYAIQYVDDYKDDVREAYDRAKERAQSALHWTD